VVTPACDLGPSCEEATPWVWFWQKNCMSFDTFNTLLKLLCPAITCNIIKSLNSCHSLANFSRACPCIWAAMACRRQLYLDQKDVYGFSRGSCYRVQDVFLDAVLN
jgi:hypothetical protein